MPELGDAFLRTSWTQLRKRTRSRKETYYFVVDGLDNIPVEDVHVTKFVLDMLPIGLPGFRFLLSGQIDRLSKQVSEQVSLKTYTLSGFTIGQTVEYFKHCGVDQSSLSRIHRICRRMPGRLSQARRILLSGGTIQDLLEETEWFDVEWRRIDAEDDSQLSFLAVLAHGGRRFAVHDLARILNQDAAAIQQLIDNLSFLSIDPISGGIGFVSEPFRKFAADRLVKMKDQVHNILIEDLVRDPDGDTSRMYLPGYLEQAGRFEEILNYFSPEHFPRMLELNQTTSLAKQQTDLGIDAALRLHRDGDLIRLCAQKSELIELDGAKVWRSEVEARMALGDYSPAIALSQSVATAEERLHLLAIVAKKQCEQGSSPEPEILEQIRHLFGTITPAVLGERAIEIASDLIYAEPDLAIDMVEQATSSVGDENVLDQAFARLSVAALGMDGEKYRAVETLESIRARAKNPDVRSFASAASLLVRDCSATEVVAQAEKLGSTDKQLFLLRQWALDNREREDAVEVAEYGLTLTIEMAPYSPNASVLREIASPLPFVRDEARTRRLVSRFDSQKGAIERLGPTEDYVRLQLLLAETEGAYDFESATLRLLDVYMYICDLSEMALKTGCIARFLATLAKMDPEATLESKDDLRLHSLSESDLASGEVGLLNATAEHYYATRSIIRALAQTRPELAVELTTSLNTEPRRDLALLELVKSALHVPAPQLDIALLNEAIEKFSDQDLQDEALVMTMARLPVISEEAEEDLVRGSLPLVNRIGCVQDSARRCNAYCLAYSFLAKRNAEEYASLLSHLAHGLGNTWEAIDVGWRKVDVGFKIVETLAEEAPEMAQDYLQKAAAFREKTFLPSDSAARTYLGCVRLAIRAYNGLLATKVDSEEDLESLARLIDLVPSNGERACLWAVLALYYHGAKRLENCRRITIERVKPLLYSIGSQDRGYRARVTVDVSPAVYCAHRTTALDIISRLSVQDQDKAYANICQFILRRQPLSDPYDGMPRQGYSISYEDIVDMCELISLMHNDGFVYHFIEVIADSVAPPSRRERFTRQEKPDIADRIATIIDSKLPDPTRRYIEHNGYRISAQAQLTRIRRSKSQEWLDLRVQAREIPNVADRALVLCTIAAAMPNREALRRREILQESQELIEQIPTALDRMQRYEEMASMVANIEPSMSTECLRLAMKSATEGDSPELYPAQKRIIDLAYKIDEDLAASLASIADDDPARSVAHINLKQRIEQLELKKEIANAVRSAEEVAKFRGPEYAQAAWELLGSLNAKRVTPAPLAYIREVVRLASNLAFRESYPLLAWATENAVQTFSRSEDARAQLHPVYEAMLLAAELAGRMASRSSTRVTQAARYRTSSDERTHVVIHAGEREKAIRVIREWFEHQVRDYLKICDAFFGPDELELLQMLRSVNPNCQVHILTSRKYHRDVPQPWEEAYRTHWRLRVSEHQDPPDTEVVVVGTESGGEPPIHDRWWVSRGTGLRVGHSFNSLGITKKSEISFLREIEAADLEAEMDPYLQRLEKELLGERLLYSLFTL